MSLLQPKDSVVAGVATAALVYGIYSAALPTVAETRISDPGDGILAGSERGAAYLAAAVVGGVSLLAKDPTIFVMGGSMVIAFSWLHRHANAVDPVTGLATLGRQAAGWMGGLDVNAPTGMNAA